MRADSLSRVTIGGSVIEAAAGIGAVVLAILGLSGIIPDTLAAIGMIAAGGAFISQGGAVATQYSKAMSLSTDDRIDAAELGGGLTAEILGGIAGATLGILALIGIQDQTLLAVAAIVFGSSLLLGSGMMARLNAISREPMAEHETADFIAREAVMATGGAQVLAGIGAGALGVLALVGIQPMTLILVALLTVGAAIVVSGSAVTAKMMTLLQG